MQAVNATSRSLFSVERSGTVFLPDEEVIQDE
jgi:hypothetical protein